MAFFKLVVWAIIFLTKLATVLKQLLSDSSKELFNSLFADIFFKFEAAVDDYILSYNS